jgi:hypothetical protein
MQYDTFADKNDFNKYVIAYGYGWMILKSEFLVFEKYFLIRKKQE